MASELIVYTYFFSASEEVFPEVTRLIVVFFFFPRICVTHFCLAVTEEHFSTQPSNDSTSMDDRKYTAESVVSLLLSSCTFTLVAQ